MDPVKQREIACKGGRAAHAAGTAHEFTAAEAREAGRKGGRAAHKKGTAHTVTPEEAREAARLGGTSRRQAAPGDRSVEALPANPAAVPTEPTPA